MIQIIIQILMHQSLLSKTVLSIKNIRSYISENLNIEPTFLPWKNQFKKIEILGTSLQLHYPTYIKKYFGSAQKCLKICQDKHITGFPVRLKDQMWQPHINTLNSRIQEVSMLSMRQNSTWVLKLVEKEKKCNQCIAEKKKHVVFFSFVGY